ncbi:hypothetical protein OFC05_25905, partial [Escherichia coli]|nr:hypothetical protein [Escherichia coli]
VILGTVAIIAVMAIIAAVAFIGPVVRKRWIKTAFLLTSGKGGDYAPAPGTAPRAPMCLSQIVKHEDSCLEWTE